LPEEPPRLLFDENLAARLVRALSASYPGSAHVRPIGLAPAPDHAIWEYARDNGFVIVTKDEDFVRYGILYGPPPKVIWIGLGNCSTADIMRLLNQRRSDIGRFLADGQAAFLALS
jgi:predicted nuclease of predicted toxin-antitoxin system